MKSIRLLAVALGLALGAPLQAAENNPPPLQKVFKQWQVTCNNINDCDVRNLDEGLRIIIDRQAGPQGAVSLRFQGFGNDNPQGIWLDGQRWNSDLSVSKAAEDDFDVASTDSLAIVQQWVQASKNALKLALTADGDAASLSGLNAALLLVDERQGRLGNQTALLKVGNNEPDQVPARPRPPTFSFAPPKVVALSNAQALIDGAIKANLPLLQKEGCEPDAESRARSEAQPLNAQQALVLINCGLGAYQSSSMLFISERADVTRSTQLTLPLPLAGESGEPERLSWFTEGGYDPAAGELWFSGRGRGIADCGHNGSWKYDGKTFHLASYNNQPSCNGGEPGDWPSVWLSSVADR